ncbi:MAG: TolC family protein [Acidobacteriota bacterium]|nr:TolC family protein [Acidobacteriota bacterium]
MFNPRPTRALLCLSAVMLLAPAAHAQTKSPATASQKEVEEETREIRSLRAQYVQATKDYKSSLGQLLPFYEADVKRAEERLAKTKELYAQGLVDKRQVDAAEAETTAAREKVASVKAQLKSADEQMAETLVEAESEATARKLVAQRKRRERTRDGRVYYVRFVIVGEVTIYDYTGAVRGHVIKRGQRVLADSRR